MIDSNRNLPIANIDALALLERENRRLKRELSHIKNARAQEKTATTTLLNQHKVATYTQRERERTLALLLANLPSIILLSNHDDSLTT